MFGYKYFIISNKVLTFPATLKNGKSSVKSSLVKTITLFWLKCLDKLQTFCQSWWDCEETDTDWTSTSVTLNLVRIKTEGHTGAPSLRTGGLWPPLGRAGVRIPSHFPFLTCDSSAWGCSGTILCGSLLTTHSNLPPTGQVCVFYVCWLFIA